MNEKSRQKSPHALPPYLTIADAFALADRIERGERTIRSVNDMTMAVALIRVLLRERSPNYVIHLEDE